MMTMLFVDVPKAATSTRPSRIAGIAMSRVGDPHQDLADPAFAERGGETPGDADDHRERRRARTPSSIDVRPP